MSNPPWAAVPMTLPGRKAAIKSEREPWQVQNKVG